MYSYQGCQIKTQSGLISPNLGQLWHPYYFVRTMSKVSSCLWPDPPENWHLTVKKLPKTWHFFKKIAKNFHFFKNNCQWQFFFWKKKTIFGHFFKMWGFWQFFLYSNCNFPEGHLSFYSTLYLCLYLSLSLSLMKSVVHEH